MNKYKTLYRIEIIILSIKYFFYRLFHKDHISWIMYAMSNIQPMKKKTKVKFELDIDYEPIRQFGSHYNE